MVAIWLRIQMKITKDFKQTHSNTQTYWIMTLKKYKFTFFNTNIQLDFLYIQNSLSAYLLPVRKNYMIGIQLRRIQKKNTQTFKHHSLEYSNFLNYDPDKNTNLPFSIQTSNTFHLHTTFTFCVFTTPPPKDNKFLLLPPLWLLSFNKASGRVVTSRTTLSYFIGFSSPFKTSITRGSHWASCPAKGFRSGSSRRRKPTQSITSGCLEWRVKYDKGSEPPYI